MPRLYLCFCEGQKKSVPKLVDYESRAYVMCPAVGQEDIINFYIENTLACIRLSYLDGLDD